MDVRIHFHGRLQYRLQALAELSRSVIEVWSRRAVKGPRRRGWNWFVEVSTEALKRQLITTFGMPGVERAREYLDVIDISSPALSQVERTKLVNEKVRGAWVTPKNAAPGVTVLYLHGGGYSFYPRSYAHFEALVALAAKARTFVLDYRLSPEHRFPAQLEDAMAAYRWLLTTSCSAKELVIIGDSAGGNLTLALLLAAREVGVALPALAVALSPPPDFESEYPSMSANEQFDWINGQMLRSWADWYCDAEQRRNPWISPLWADLRGLPPIYIQAGQCEILYDSIRAFADRAREQGTAVTLESWEDMNHVFQMFGMDAPQSSEALRRIGEVIGERARARESCGTLK